MLAAALPENFLTVTAWINAFATLKLGQGEALLLRGGSSGIGLTATRLAKAFGATVFIAASTDEKTAFCRKIGVHHAFSYRTQDLEAEIAAIAGRRGIDVILDMVGGDYINKNLRLLATEEWLAFIAFLEGSKAEVDFERVMAKRQTSTGSALSARPDAQKAAIARSLLEKVWPLLERGEVKPVIHEVFPLERVTEAHRLMESSRHIGKVMLEIAPARAR